MFIGRMLDNMRDWIADKTCEDFADAIDMMIRPISTIKRINE